LDYEWEVAVITDLIIILINDCQHLMIITKLSHIIIRVGFNNWIEPIVYFIMTDLHHIYFYYQVFIISVILSQRQQQIELVSIWSDLKYFSTVFNKRKYQLYWMDYSNIEWTICLLTRRTLNRHKQSLFLIILRLM